MEDEKKGTSTPDAILTRALVKMNDTLGVLKVSIDQLTAAIKDLKTKPPSQGE